MFKIIFNVCCVLLLAGQAWAGDISKRAPRNGDVESHYLFYMHGLAVEKGGRRVKGPSGRIYEYDKIVTAFADVGFHVISEARPKDTKPPRYVKQLRKQVKKLLKSGVPENHITIAGHSKGGFMTLMASDMMDYGAINYVVMAGCGTNNSRISRVDKFTSLSGRVLSTYDKADDEAGSCKDLFDRIGGGAETDEIAYETGEGHALYYEPQDLWISDVARWAGL